jgi:hypothetical protein
LKNCGADLNSKAQTPVSKEISGCQSAETKTLEFELFWRLDGGVCDFQLQ